MSISAGMSVVISFPYQDDATKTCNKLLNVTVTVISYVICVPDMMLQKPSVELKTVAVMVL